MNPGPVSEHRLFTRIAFPIKARMRVGHRDWPTEVLDLSLRGALFKVPSDWPGRIGLPAELEVVIAEGVVIRMQGNIAHMENRHAGMVCKHIDLDSAAHLRRLVELNLGDDSQLHRELAAMINRP